MKRKINLWILLIILVALTACSPASAENGATLSETVPTQADTAPTQAAATAAITVRHVFGEAHVLRDGRTLALAQGELLSQGDEIQTGADGLVILRLEGGKQVHVAENTLLDVTLLESGEGGENTVFSLKSGSVISVIDQELEAKDSYEVETPELIMAIRGTIVSVGYDAAPGSSSVTFFDGRGLVSSRTSADVAETVAGESVHCREGKLDRADARPDRLSGSEQRFLFDDGYRALLEADEAESIAARLESLLAGEAYREARARYNNGPEEEPAAGTEAPAATQGPAATEATEGFTLEDARSSFSAAHPDADISVTKKEGDVYYIEGWEGSVVYKMKFAVKDGTVVLDLTVPTRRHR